MLFYLLLKRKTKENKRTLSPCNYIFISDFLFMFFRFIFCVINCLLVNKLTWNLTKETCSSLQPADFHLLQSIISLQHKGYYTNYPPPNFPSSFVQFLISSSVFSFTKLPRLDNQGLERPTTEQGGNPCDIGCPLLERTEALALCEAKEWLL